MRVPLSNIVSYLLTLTMALGAHGATQLRCLMYLTGQHPEVPAPERVRHVTHVALAFMPSSYFNEYNRTEWPLFTQVPDVRTKFSPSTKVMIAIGGWGDTDGFSLAAKTNSSRKTFADNIARMVAAIGADGIDVDWEYPGGNGEDYKQVNHTNKDKRWEVEAYPLLISAIRNALGPQKVMSAAVPGKELDMIAFTEKTVPRLMKDLDFLNVMTYDLMNRRNHLTQHHSGLAGSLDALSAYMHMGAASPSLNLGLGFYVKWFRTQHDHCTEMNPPGMGCRALTMEHPYDGTDMGKSGAFAWCDEVPEELKESFEKAVTMGQWDEHGGGYFYWDDQENIFWSYDTPTAIQIKFRKIVAAGRVGGVFAWGLGEDGPLYSHLDAVNEGIKELNQSGKAVRDEL